MGGYAARKILTGIDLWFTLAASAAAAYWFDAHTLTSASSAAGSAQAQVGMALLGVIVAGYAILIVFMDDEYVAVLEKVPPGSDAAFLPFICTALVAALCAASGVLLILVGSIEVVDEIRLRLVFGFALWMFLYLLWSTFDLVLWLTAHTRNRILLIKRRSKPRG